MTFHLTDTLGNNERKKKKKKKKKKLCYTGGDGETAVPACCVSMDEKLYIYIIPVGLVRMNEIPAYCVYVLYLWRW